VSDVSEGCGARLRWWRQHHGLSQLELAGEAGTSQRHMSGPRRAGTWCCGSTAALGVPLRQQNALLLVAGCAPAWGERVRSAPELDAVNRALESYGETYGIEPDGTGINGDPAPPGATRRC
jgi:transcriptional regulator with XRE-family HTH domain